MHWGRRFFIAVLVFALSASAHASVVPVISSAHISGDGTLLIQGTGFVTAPLPRVWLGKAAGGFEELPVLAATPTTIEAAIGDWPPGTYRLTVTFGQWGLLVSTLSFTIGAVGPQGEPGAQGPPGLTGSQGPQGPAGPAGILGLAGQACAPGSFVRGFGNAGELTCEPISVHDPTAPQPSETILLWHLDEGAGSTAADSSGNGRTGSIINPDWVHGRFGGALRFNGGAAGAQYVELADDAALTPASPWAVTFDLWIYPLALNVDNQMIIHKYQNHAPGNSDYLLFLINSELNFATQGTELLSTTLAGTGRWYHITAIANGADSRLYVDGVLKASGQLSPVPNGTVPLFLGSCVNACAPNNRTFNGVIDEFWMLKGVRIP